MYFCFDLVTDYEIGGVESKDALVSIQPFSVQSSLVDIDLKCVCYLIHCRDYNQLIVKIAL